jgi:hypothetical protein
MNETPEPKAMERLTLLATFVFQEQAFFWQRFASFSALHAGLLVLASSTALDAKPFPRAVLMLLALILAIAWIRIQLTSLWYVDRYKPQFHEARRLLNFTYPPKTTHSNPAFSTTNIAISVPIAVTAIWSVLLYFDGIPGVLKHFGVQVKLPFTG